MAFSRSLEVCAAEVVRVTASFFAALLLGHLGQSATARVTGPHMTRSKGSRDVIQLGSQSHERSRKGRREGRRCWR